MKKKLEKGLVQVYTGNGKGKTTCALGLAFRAIGHDLKVCVVQYLKGSSYAGEIATVQRLKPYIDFYQFGRGCPRSSMIRSGMMKCTGCGECFTSEKFKEEDTKYALMAYEFTKEVLAEEEYDLVILDEINNALRLDFLTIEQVLELISLKSELTELILTGRGIPAEIIAAADLVSEIQEIKHPYKKGITSRRGIEY